MQIYKYILPIIVIDVFIYFGTSSVLIIFLLLSPLIYGLKYYQKSSIMLFFSLTYLLPYSFLDWHLGNNYGDIIDNYFICGIPLYIAVIISTVENNNIHYPKIFKYGLFLFTVIYFYSTFGRMVAYQVFGVGTRVSPSVATNFLNAILVGYLGYKSFSIEHLKQFSILIIVLGTIVSLTGILQYFFNFFFFTSKYVYSPNERLSIVCCPDPVDLFPFLIVPFAFGLQYLNEKESNHKPFVSIALLIILISSIFTWSRWGLFVLIIIIYITIFNKVSLKRSLILGIMIYLIYSLLQTDYLTQYASELQQARMANDDTLLQRYLLWGLAIIAIKNNWLFGVGLGNGPSVAFSQTDYFLPFNIGDLVERFIANIKLQTLHSYFLDWILSMGILIIIPIGLLFMTMFKNYIFIKSIKSNQNVFIFSNSIILSIIGLSIFYIQNSGDAYYFYLFFFSMSVYLKCHLTKKHLYD